MSSERFSTEGYRQIPRPPGLPPIMADEAFHGLAGDIVNAIAPYTEASKEALLMQLLAGIGNIVGSGTHFVTEDDRHPARLFVLLVGDTSLSGKGTSWSRVRAVLRKVDAPWTKDRVLGSLSSGEGLIKYIKRVQGDPDEVFAQLRRAKSNEEVSGILQAHPVLDVGNSQHPSLNGRLMLVQQEFARTLRVMKRENNTLPDVLREAFDQSELTNPTVKADFVEGVHFSAVGHITEEELLQLFAKIDIVNGLGNRFLFVMTSRRQEVPRGMPVPDEDMEPLIDKLQKVVELAQTEQLIDFDDDAKEYWDEAVYHVITGPTPGLVSKLLDRARAHIRRLALLFTILDDNAEATTIEHLEAALAVWEYCANSAKYLFDYENSTGDPDLDLVVQALGSAGQLRRSQITSEVFKGNKGRYTTVKLRVESVQKRGEELEVLEVRAGKRKGKRGAIPQIWILKE
ncbi:MAG TPA: DUF3987 domain-containing protein [Acidimicrobiia bacterium]|nr:DUF3987 domain-containing protein [Acidimicrobiia bacterium]